MSMDAVTDDEHVTLEQKAGKATAKGAGTASLVMLATDAASLQLSVFVGYALHLLVSLFFPIGLTAGHYLDAALAAALAPLAFLILGFYPGYGMCPVARLRKRVMITSAVFSVLFVWSLAKGTAPAGLTMLALSGVIAWALPWICEAIVREMAMKAGLWGRKVIVLGAGEAGASIIDAMVKRPETGFVPVAAFDDDSSRWGSLLGPIKVEGGLADAKVWAEKGISTAIYALPQPSGKVIADYAQSAPFEHVVVIPELDGAPTAWVTPIDFQTVPGLMISNKLRAPYNRFIKRALDFLVAVPATLVALPIILIGGIWIKMADGGPIFYAQRRRGLNNRTIDVLKIRTMYTDADVRLEQLLENDPAAKAEWERFFKLKNDPRILPGIGHLLRKTSLDELPQLFNVLRGDMTLIGPRPFPDYHLAEFDDEDFKTLRASVVPGLTGYWQVSARSDGDLDVQKHLDSYYIRNWSLWLDFYILMRTALVVIRGSGAY